MYLQMFYLMVYKKNIVQLNKMLELFTCFKMYVISDVKKIEYLEIESTLN